MENENDKAPGPLHIAIILDRSGSMGSVRDETISGFNEQVQTIRATASENGALVDVTLVLFNNVIKFPIRMAKVAELREIGPEDYVPDCNTAMLDAVGRTLVFFDTVTQENDRFLIIIISDGHENASAEFNYQTIARMIRQRQETGRWTFSYVGANQDLSQVERDMGIPAGNMMHYISSAEGSRIMFSSVAESMSRYITGKNEDDATFFDDGKKRKKKPTTAN